MAHGEKLEFLSLAKVEADLAQHWTLQPLAHRTSGPSRYVHVQETGGRIGFIAPMSGNFCASCNRVRVTAAGRLYPCLGHDLYFDFAKIMRGEDRLGQDALGQDALGQDALRKDAALDALVARAMHQKPEQHDFVSAIEHGNAAVSRTMSATGG
jgi:cyclic pyranopterin phosphate synthase